MKRGFTLIELLAVVVIIAIIATVGFYSITNIINQSRLRSLNDTAFNIKRAAAIYFSSHSEEISDIMEIDMTPNRGEFANLIELGKDPWNKDYIQVKAIGTKNNSGQIEIAVYLFTEKGDYVLYPNEKETREIEFLASNLASPNSIDINNNITISFDKNNIYQLTGVIPIVKKDGSLANSSDYSLVGSSQNQVTLLMKTAGNYTVNLILQRALGSNSKASNPINFVVNDPPPPPLDLSGTYYFNNTTRAINGVNYYTLTTSYNTSRGYFGYIEPVCVNTGVLRAFIRVGKISASGVDTTISNWRQAPVAIGASYLPIMQSNTYSFAGWSNASTTDSLLIEVGLSDSLTGLPVFSRKFVTNQLNNANVSAKTFTVYYMLDNDWDDGCYAQFYYGGNVTEPNRAKIVIN